MSSTAFPDRLASRDIFDKAVAHAQSAARVYYDTDRLEMSDNEYDDLVEAISAAQLRHPQWDDDGVLTQVADGGNLTHPEPMLSLAKTTELSDLDTFTTTVGGPVVVEMKLDGNAVRATYTDGQRVALATRGDGIAGERLDNSLDIAGLPKTISSRGTLHVTGEVYMTDDDFDQSNTNRIASGKPGFAKPRNAASGVLRRDTKTFDAFLSFAAYHGYGQKRVDAAEGYQQRLHILSSFGIRTVASLHEELGLVTTATTSPAAVRRQVAAMVHNRSRLPVGIDGAVIKTVSFVARERLGSATRHPKWALAYKFAPMEATSVLADVEISVGRSGRMSLTAVLEHPGVTIDGSVITRATLHNMNFVEDQGLGVGSRVLVTLANDIIPRVVSLDDQPEDIVAWVPPVNCPTCGQPWDSREVMWRCHTPSCALANLVSYAASRDVLDIDGLGDEVASALVDTGHLSDLSDIFYLTVPQVSTTRIGTTSTGNPKLVGDVVAAKIVASMNAAKAQPLNRIVCALGIGKMGLTMSRRLANHFGSLAAMRAANEDEFQAVEGVAGEKAAVYVAGFAHMSHTIDRMVAAGVSTTMANADTAVDGLPLAGLTVVVTGSMAGTKLAGLNRNQMQELVERAGGKPSGSVSARTSLLVCGEAGSSKFVKATTLGVHIVTPDEFAERVNRYLQFSGH